MPTPTINPGASPSDVAIGDRQFRKLCDLVYAHCGINLHDGKQELVRARIARLLRARDFRSANDYLDSVIADPTGEEFAALIDALSTNLTSFFRESTHFTFLADKLLPRILDRRRKQRDTRIRGWSAACSTGEEPYTLGITLLEALRDAGPSWDVKILATDISRNVLKTAVVGRYDATRLAAVAPELRAKYFVPPGASRAARAAGGAGGAGGTYQVAPAVRNLVTFNYLNLMDAWPFTGPFDFIFCRNVMIYFDKQTQQRLVNRFWECLDPGGVLFTGHSESLTGISHKFQYVQPTIYMK